jgi:regulator of protease activity HflC (stomatin/prohibitin superfamily)
VQVGVDGILYLKVLNAERASYGISDYLFAITSSRRRCSQRDRQDRSGQDLRGADQHQHGGGHRAGQGVEPWGVKVLRYEIKNITPPHDILAAMEKQMRAEREKRA